MQARVRESAEAVEFAHGHVEHGQPLLLVARGPLRRSGGVTEGGDTSQFRTPCGAVGDRHPPCIGVAWGGAGIRTSVAGLVVTGEIFPIWVVVLRIVGAVVGIC